MEAAKTHPRAHLGRQMAYKTTADRAIAMAATVVLPSAFWSGDDSSPVSGSEHQDHDDVDTVYRSDESTQGFSPTPSQMADEG